MFPLPESIIPKFVRTLPLGVKGMSENKNSGHIEQQSHQKEKTDTAGMLNFIRQGTQMGRQGILDLLGKTEDPAFRRELKRQLGEYETLYEAADGLLKQQGAKQEDVSSVAKFSAQMMTAMKTWKDPSVSHMAEMMVQGNTMGVTETIRKQKAYRDSGETDPRVEKLAGKFLATEEENVEGMKRFL